MLFNHAIVTINSFKTAYCTVQGTLNLLVIRITMQSKMLINNKLEKDCNASFGLNHHLGKKKKKTLINYLYNIQYVCKAMYAYKMHRFANNTLF